MSTEMSAAIETPATKASPRGVSRERAILAAAVDLIGEVGYERLTMDAVATRARASKATIYRRWPGKADMIAEALRQQAESEVSEIADTGSLQGDLLLAVDGIANALVGRHGLSLLGLIEAVRGDEVLRDLIRAQIEAKSHAIGQAVIDRARARGEHIRPLDVRSLFDLALSQLFMRAVLHGDRADAHFQRQLVDDVLVPLLTGCP